jgi:Tfp pilus assembly protein PilN
MIMTEFNKKDISILIIVLIGIIMLLTGVIYKDRLQINDLLIRNERLSDEKEELQELLQESDELFKKQLVLVKELMTKLYKKDTE